MLREEIVAKRLEDAFWPTEISSRVRNVIQPELF
jgi:hypothetical protein